jgi:hypothetical protein
MLPQTPTSTEFYSPSRNISCEIDYNFGASSISQAYCLTVTPQQSATLKLDGSLVKCSGANCLSNAGLNTPELPYGTSISLGPFICLSTTSGMRCTLANGAGYVISTSGVAALGSATVTNTTSNT